MSIHASVTAYKGILAIRLLTDHSIEGQVTTSLDTPNTIGQVIHNTREHLGVSAEALVLLKAIRKGPGSLGKVMWFNTSDGKQSFGWIGHGACLIDPFNCLADRDYLVTDNYVLIENEVEEDAKRVIDAKVSHA